jgi:flagellar hook-length control protein FliK
MSPALFPVNNDAVCDVTAATKAAVGRTASDETRGDRFARLLFSAVEEPAGAEKKNEKDAEESFASLLFPAFMTKPVQETAFPAVPGDVEQAGQVDRTPLLGVASGGVQGAGALKASFLPDTGGEEPRATVAGRGLPAAPTAAGLPGSEAVPDWMRGVLPVPARPEPESIQPVRKAPVLEGAGVALGGPTEDQPPVREAPKAPVLEGAGVALGGPTEDQSPAREAPKAPVLEGVPLIDAPQFRAEAARNAIQPDPAVPVVRRTDAGSPLAEPAVIRVDAGAPLPERTASAEIWAQLLPAAAEAPARVLLAAAPPAERADASFSISMTDNVRPRVRFPILDARTPSEDDASEEAPEEARTETPSYRRSRIAPVLSEVVRRASGASDARPVTDLSSASEPERALKAAAEGALSTNRLPEGREQERSIFPPARSLFGEQDNTGASQRSAADQQTRSGRILGDQPGKERDRVTDALKAAPKDAPDHSLLAAARQDQGVRRPAEPASGLPQATSLPGRGGEALEDGVQHVVRFLRAEGRQSAGIIVDPPALGRIEIELVSLAKTVEASIKVSSEQVRQLVQDHITILRNHLEQQGVHLGEFVVDLRDNSKGGTGREGFGRDSGRRGGASSRDEAEAVEAPLSFRMDLEHGMLYLLA